MTQNNKPEWFEITDKDEKPELRKVSKSLPISAVLVVALIFGAGAVVTQTQNETLASAANADAVQSPSTQSTPSAKKVKPAVKSPKNTPAPVVEAVATNKLVNPSISTLPTGGGDDEDVNEHHGRGHHDDEDDDDDEYESDDD